MSWLAIFLVVATAQQPQPVQIIFEGRLSEPRPATSWDCNFIDFAGNTLVLTGRFPEAPVGWDSYNEQMVEVSGLAPPHFLGSSGCFSLCFRGGGFHGRSQGVFGLTASGPKRNRRRAEREGSGES